MALKRALIAVVLLKFTSADDSDAALLPYEAFAKCINQGILTPRSLSAHWLCDPHNLLNNPNYTALVESTLEAFQTTLDCRCARARDCVRPGEAPAPAADGEGRPPVRLLMRSAFTAAVVVVDRLPDPPRQLATEARQIYDQLQLAVGECDNGLLVLFAPGTASFYTHRGADTLPMLDVDELKEINARARRDPMPLLHLLNGYFGQLRGDEPAAPVASGPRQKNWMADLRTIPLVVYAGAAVLFALMLATLALACAACCYPNRDRHYSRQYNPHKDDFLSSRGSRYNNSPNTVRIQSLAYFETLRAHPQTASGDVGSATASTVGEAASDQYAQAAGWPAGSHLAGTGRQYTYGYNHYARPDLRPPADDRRHSRVALTDAPFGSQCQIYRPAVDEHSPQAADEVQECTSYLQ